jgi:hypothetical protein
MARWPTSCSHSQAIERSEDSPTPLLAPREPHIREAWISLKMHGLFKGCEDAAEGWPLSKGKNVVGVGQRQGCKELSAADGTAE